MPDQATTTRTVLFIDSDQAYLEVLSQSMTVCSHGHWELELAPTTSRALAVLKDKPVNLIVIDYLMPRIDGLQFLKLLQRKYPGIPKAILTATGDEKSRAACLANGAELYLEKPHSPEGLEIVFATLDELAKCQSETGFRGMLRRVGLQDVLQMECLARSSIILEVVAGVRRGRIYIKQGAILHAEVDDLRGEDAFNKLMGLSGGGFELKPFKDPTETTIEGSWEALLMEAARKRDEDAGAAAELALQTPASPKTSSDTVDDSADDDLDLLVPDNLLARTESVPAEPGPAQSKPPVPTSEPARGEEHPKVSPASSAVDSGAHDGSQGAQPGLSGPSDAGHAGGDGDVSVRGEPTKPATSETPKAGEAHAASALGETTPAEHAAALDGASIHNGSGAMDGNGAPAGRSRSSLADSAGALARLPAITSPLKLQGPSLDDRARQPSRTEEVVLASLEGQVLYEWNCMDAELRVSFLQFVVQKAEQLAQGFPLGAVERIEVEDGAARIIAKLDGGRGVFLRVVKVEPFEATAPSTQEDSTRVKSF